VISIFTATFNDEVVMPHFIKWYRDRFTNCKIFVADNRSTDNTVNVCKNLGCIVRPFDSGNYVPIEVGLWFRNNAWKEADTDWVIIIDCDEFLDINENEIKEEQKNGASLIRSTGWDMFNLNEDLNIENMNYGRLNKFYNKIVCFDKSKIIETNFNEGGHYCSPEGDIKFSTKSYNLLHKKYVNVDYVCKKYEQNILRLHSSYIREKFGEQYLLNRENIRLEFEKGRRLCIKLKSRDE